MFENDNKPKAFCQIGGCPDESKTTCPSCIHYVPTQGSKYHNCAQYQEGKILCDLPVSECKTCDRYIPNILGCKPGPGRPNVSGIDWDNVEERNKYMQQTRYYKNLKKWEAIDPDLRCANCSGHYRKFQTFTSRLTGSKYLACWSCAGKLNNKPELRKQLEEQLSELI